VATRCVLDRQRHVLTANNTVVNTIDYKNTGIILRVLPRASATGNIVLDIEQEISSVAAEPRRAR